MFRKSSRVLFILFVIIIAVSVSACTETGTVVSAPSSDSETETGDFVPSQFVVPKLTSDWSKAVKLYDLPQSGFSGDYTVFRDNSGRFHIIGMDNHAGTDTSFFIAGGALSGKMSYESRIDSSETALNLWSPCVIFSKEHGKYFLFYHYQTKYGESQIRIMVSDDASPDSWVPANFSSLKEGCIAFSGDSASDPYVIYDTSISKYIMYYTGNGILLRTSTDLVKWSDPVNVLAFVDNYKYVNSPCVINKNGKYYLFVGCSDFGRTAVFCSDKYNSFSESDFLGEINGHCVRILSDGQTDYIFSSQINNWKGKDYYSRNSRGKYSLPGIYVQKLQWVSENSAEWLRISSSSLFDDNELVFITDEADYHWSFDGNVSEEHGYGNKIVPDSSCFEDGLDGKCLVCNNSFYDTGIYDLKLGSEFTISFYIKMADSKGQWNIFFSKGPKAAGHLEIYTSPEGSLSFYQAELGIEDMKINVADNRWHHCAFTYDGSLLKCYVDGANVMSLNYSGVPSDNKDHPFAIGCLYEYDSPIFFYNGLLDDLKIFNRVIDSVSYN